MSTNYDKATIKAQPISPPDETPRLFYEKTVGTAHMHPAPKSGGGHRAAMSQARVQRAEIWHHLLSCKTGSVA
jgi:hypothetical protein